MTTFIFYCLAACAILAWFGTRLDQIKKATEKTAEEMKINNQLMVKAHSLESYMDSLSGGPPRNPQKNQQGIPHV